MKCPRCGEEMREGYIYLRSSEIGYLYWSMVEPHSRWFHQKEAVQVLIENLVLLPGKENWLRRAYRCEKCGLITFEEKYTLSSEEKKPE
jgi:hypothetical protein